MSKFERHRRILDLVNAEGKVSVESIKNAYNISDVTVRKDLSELEDAGLLIRTHGGAVKVERDTDSISSNSSVSSFYNDADYKKLTAVAKRCADLIPEYKWVYMSSGITCYEMSKYMQHCKNTNIVTSGLSIAINLAENKEISVFLPGGDVVVTPRSNYIYGDHFLRTLGGLSIDVAFVGFLGIDINEGLSVGNANEMLLVKKIREVSKKVIVPVDSTKFDHRAFMCVEPLTYADAYVTNSDISDKYRNYFKEHNIELIEV